MPSNELKQRKKTSQGKQDEKNDNASNPCGEEEEAKKVDVTDGKRSVGEQPTSLSMDLRTIACVLSIIICLSLSWVVLQQNIKFAEVEEKYQLLYQKTKVLQELENEIGQVTRKLDSSENDLHGAISSMSLVTKLEEDISSLHTVVTAMQDGEQSASLDIQGVNRHFLNVTEAWQGSLELITQDIGGLRAESRSVHTQVTEKVNEAEGKVREMEKRLEELEDSTRMNARVLENTEEDDTHRIQDQLDWNTRQIRQLEERQSALSRRDAELRDALAEHLPRAERCEEYLPDVEEAVRSILRLASDLSAAQRRVEELTLQVFGVEDSALKAVSEILDIKQALDALQVDNSILKMRNDLGVVKETVKEFYRIRREVAEDLEPSNEEEAPNEGKDAEQPDLNEPAEQGDFRSVQTLLEKLEGQSVLSHVESLEHDVAQLKEWASGLTAKREKLQESLSGLSEAVKAIEGRTAAITHDVSAKVASVRTDVRRMAGLESEVEALLASEQELEEKVALAERAMVKRIGDVLASSIDRVSALRSSTERNGQSIEKLRRQLAELSASDNELASRILALESGRARLLKTVTFASDLKPKVSTIKKDFAMLDPQVSDLTLRIGRLAEDLMRREEEIALLRETFANLTAVQGDLQLVQQQLTQVPNMSEMFSHTNQPGEAFSFFPRLSTCWLRPEPREDSSVCLLTRAATLLCSSPSSPCSATTWPRRACCASFRAACNFAASASPADRTLSKSLPSAFLQALDTADRQIQPRLQGLGLVCEGLHRALSLSHSLSQYPSCVLHKLPHRLNLLSGGCHFLVSYLKLRPHIVYLSPQGLGSVLSCLTGRVELTHRLSDGQQLPLE
ncbi:hypothetical protein JZ751_008837 [Albula glossodonta]|uniref:Uncharacterized protein n=1 Tax=Albula glossodonta TaxID=121402 RepID=A0A8T2NXC9_9TELE|nr:hypothetical protein JZ751_008837 [Albula glossodonta]